MSLACLANEILLFVAENIGRERDVSSVAQTSRHSSSLLRSNLYQRNVQRSGSLALLWAAEHGQQLTAQTSFYAGANVQAR